MVSALQEDVGEALHDRQRAALARAAGEAAAAGKSSVVADVPPTVGPAEAPPAQQNGRPPFLDMPPPVVVPILDPKDLEPIDVAAAQAAAAAAAASNGSSAAEVAGGVSAEEVQEKLEGLLASQMDHGMLTAAAEAAAVGASADLSPAAAAEAAQQRSTAAAEEVGLAGAADVAGWGPGGALEQQPQEGLLQRISENVLAVTVRRLIAAAEDALDQEPPAVPGEASVDTTQLAVEYLEELEVGTGRLAVHLCMWCHRGICICHVGSRAAEVTQSGGCVKCRAPSRQGGGHGERCSRI